MHTMTWTGYTTFALFALVLTLVPGPDFAVVSRNALRAGRSAGAWASAGVATSNVVQGTVVAVGLGAVLVRSQPVFAAIRWAGVVYLCWLGFQALRSAVRGAPVEADAESALSHLPAAGWRSRLRWWRQGFLCNITNPKVLVFYLSVLPQFLRPDSTVADALALAYTHALMGLLWLTALAAGLHLFRAWFNRTRVRRWLDVLTAGVLLGFAGKLAADGV